MTKSDWLTALAVFLAALLIVPAPAVAAPDLIEVCHHTADATRDGLEWRKIRVSERSLQNHLDHGDVLAGEPIPGTSHLLDSDCNVTEDEAPSPPEPSEPPKSEPPTRGPSSEVIFAVAYSDVDPSDGAYNPGLDVLIAKLIDGPDEASDGLPGVGDLIITGHYPEDFAMSGYGAFGVGEHAVTGIGMGLDYFCWVESGAGTFVWSSGQGDFDQYAEWSSTETRTNLYDDRSLSTLEKDEILIAPSSPSSPSSNVALGGSDLSDQAFIDVQADCSL